MATLSPMPRDQLRGFERIAVPVMEAINARPPVRRAIHATLGQVNGQTILWLTGRLLDVRGMDTLQRLQAPKGLIVVANHRSFFDFYFISSVITRRTPLMREVTFPVRSPFFYDNPLGLVLNIAVSGATMWPPVFRDERRRTLNPTGLQQVSASLDEGVVMGIHPEGTRNKNPDPHSFLPLKPGLGQLLEVLDPAVVLLPCFIVGASSSVLREVGRNFKPASRRGDPIRIRFGSPQTAAELLAQSRDPAALTELAFAQVRELCEADRLEFARPSP